MSWLSLPLNTQNIEVVTDKAVLIVIPHKVCKRLGLSEDFKFWHPLKLVREQTKGKGWLYNLSLTEDFEIKTFKNGQGKYNKATKIKEKVISGSDLIQAWSEE